MWPISPAACRPVHALPFRTSPPPTPVPQKTPRIDRYGLPAPSRNSAIVPTRTSWPRCTAAPSSSARLAPTGTGASQPETTLRAFATVPASASTVPGDPTPTPSSADGSTPAAPCRGRSDRLRERPHDALGAGVLGRRHAVLSEHLRAAVDDDRLDLRASEIDASAHAPVPSCRGCPDVTLPRVPIPECRYAARRTVRAWSSAICSAGTARLK